MKVTCQSCQAKYSIADEKIKGRVAKIRCKKCSSTIVVDGTQPIPQEAAVADSEMWAVQVAEGDQRDLTVPQIAELWVSGAVTLDTYVWKEGFTDWLALEQVPELRAQVEAGGTDEAISASIPPPSVVAPTPGPGAAFVPAAQPMPVAARAAGSGGGALESARNDAASRAEARRAGARAAGADLFATRGTEEDEVATSAAVKPMFVPSAAEKPTGARNESSVLFSLATLSGGGPPAPAAPSLKGHGGAHGGMGLLDVSPNKSKVDDIMNLGGGIFAPGMMSPALAPPPVDFTASAETAGGKRKRSGLGFIGVLAAVAIGAGGAVFGLKQAGLLGQSAPAASASSDTAATTPPAGVVAKPVTGGGDTPQADNSAAAVPAAIPPGGTPPPEEKSTKPTVTKASKKGEEKPAAAGGGGGAAPAPAPAPKAPAGGAPDAEFDRAAALSALSDAATSAQSCKKADGPTGSGRIAVTFATSGGVTVANVEGPPFAGTPVGGCVAARFRGAHVPPFGGGTVTVHKSFVIN